MAYPPKRSQIEYEKVKTEDFVAGIIAEIQYDENHKFTWQGEVKVGSAIRFVFKLDGYNFLHHSRWMRFNTGEKSNLYQKYISKLIANPKPDLEFDFDILKHMKVKTIWNEKNNFQDIESIFAAEGKIDLSTVMPIEPVNEESPEIPEDIDGI